MENNFWLYSDQIEQVRTAGPLIIFGAETLKGANIIKGFEKLEEYNSLMNSGLNYDRVSLAREFIFDYLIDCIRILIFFEGYMKAELIVRDFCVHNINNDGSQPNLKELAKLQKNEPICLRQIHETEPFVVDENNKRITNKALKDTTLGINILLGPKYRIHYQFDDSITDIIKALNSQRNKLHFNHTAEFQLSTKFIKEIKQINDFVDLTIKRWTRK